MPQRHLMDAVLAETRHGAQVQMPATDLGPYSMSEFSLRALIRRTVDSVPARAPTILLRTRALGWGPPWAGGSGDHLLPDLRPRHHGQPAAARQRVREAVRGACYENLGVSPTVNVHIEDLHDDD